MTITECIATCVYYLWCLGNGNIFKRLIVMEQYISKSALVAEIEKRINKEIQSCATDSILGYSQGCVDSMRNVLSLIDTLEVKEVDLELITGWFDHIAQIADDRMTLTNQRMTDAHALDEIKCLAKNSSEFITKHYKV